MTEHQTNQLLVCRGALFRQLAFAAPNVFVLLDASRITNTASLLITCKPQCHPPSRQGKNDDDLFRLWREVAILIVCTVVGVELLLLL